LAYAPQMQRMAIALFFTAGLGLTAGAQRSGEPSWPRGELTFVPLVGSWQPGTEDKRATITIDGTAPTLKVDDANARAMFPNGAAGFIKVMSAPGVFPLATIREVPRFTDGRLNVEFKILGGASDQTAGVVFNLRPDGTYNYARYNTKDGNVAIWKFENGTRTVLAHGELHAQLPFKVWHRMTVDIKGREVTAIVNDKLRVVHTFDRDIDGRVGLWTKADSVTAFRNFKPLLVEWK
jgi:hypothetical protein